MPYIKLLTALAGLALLTACGGAAAPADKTGGDTKTSGDTDTGEVNTTDCTATPFDTNCDAVESAITSRQTTCFTSATANPTCGAVIMGACMANPFRAETACMADTYLPNRIAECITDGNAGEAKCETLLSDTDMNTALTDCLTNPFEVACESLDDFTTFALARTNRASFCDNSDNVADDLCTGDVVMPICGTNPFNAICFTGTTYLSPRITDCIKTENTEAEKCNTLLTDTAMNTELTDCLENPFATACESVDGFTDFALARTNRLTFCNDNMNVANGLCTGENLMNVCVADPFNAICFTDATYLPARITNCITGGNAGDMKCDTIVSDATMNTAITDCLENPFATACESVSAFTTYALARTNRLTFCNDNMNVANTLCMGASRMGVCGVDPFNAICFAEPTYLTARVNNCITGGNAGDMKCDTIVSDSTMNAEITACLTNPFSDTCASNPDFDDYADMARANRVAFCESGSGELCTPLTTCNGNPFHESCGAYFAPAKIPHCAIRTNAGGDCATTLSRPNAATWAQSFATELRSTPTAGNQFLQGTATGISVGDTKTSSTNSAPPVPTILNLETATYKNVGLGGDAEDGVALFIGRIEEASYYYAGIFSGTNLGAPLPAYVAMSEPNVKLYGKIGVRGPVAITNQDFELNVNLETRKINAFVQFGISIIHYKLDADFNDEGVIVNGTVSYGNFTNRNPDMLIPDDGNKLGILTGLIGQEGAVGVFHSNNDNIGTSSYTGGFVACPTVNNDGTGGCKRP